MSVKVCKFGGTSMADGNVINAVKNIVAGDGERRYIVVSAPGKRYSGDKKVTDLLYACHSAMERGEKNAFAPVRARFASIARELNCGLDIEPILDETERAVAENGSEDFTASRGEYICARLAAKVFGAQFVDAADVIFFKPDGELDGEKTYKAVGEACAKYDFAVFPGFYGTGADGQIKTFARGGSDITGAVVARAVRASVYENWTDVSGFFACDPRIITSPRHIKELSYEELRELSYMGANVLHAESVLPVQEANIPIRIKNTFRPQDEGTCVLPLSRYIPANGLITGVSGKKNHTVVVLEKSTASGGAGFVSGALKILSGKGVAAEKISVSANGVSLVFGSGSKDGAEAVAAALKSAFSPDSVRIIKNVSLVSAVGYGISSSVGVAARIFSALSAEEINVKSADFGASKISFTVGVDDEDFEKCVKAVYYEFFGA